MIDDIITWLFTAKKRQFLEDANFLLAEQQYHDPKLKEIADKAAEKIRNHFLVGSLGGVALSLSLRRYFPQNFGEFNLLRASIETVLITGTAGFSALYSTDIVRKDVKNLKYRMVMEHNPQFKKYLAQQAKFYKINSDYTLLKDVLSNKEYLEWREVEAQAQHSDNTQ